MTIPDVNIKAIIGLGNPGPRFRGTRHNIGFMIVDALAQRYDAQWHEKDKMERAEIRINDRPVLLIKPQTFMNNSGAVIPFLQKKGIKPEEILVIHDELEKSLGTVAFKQGGSARGHNGLRSIIGAMGPDFLRLRFGIDRPERKEDVGDYVLHRFDEYPSGFVEDAIPMIEQLFSN